MKQYGWRRPAAAGLIFSALCGGASAADGTITITGNVTDVSCTIDIGGQTGGDSNVTLPSVALSSLSAVGDTAGATQISFHISECAVSSPDGKLPGTVRAHFDANNVDPQTGNLLNTESATPATGVEVQITNADNRPIDLRTNNNNPYASIKDDGEGIGSANMVYAAQYVSISDSPAPGGVKGELVYSLEYQ